MISAHYLFRFPLFRVLSHHDIVPRADRFTAVAAGMRFRRSFLVSHETCDLELPNDDRCEGADKVLATLQFPASNSVIRF